MQKAVKRAPSSMLRSTAAGEMNDERRPLADLCGGLHLQEKMIFWILVQITLTICASCKHVHHKKDLSYVVEVDHNVTVEWRFSTQTSISVPSLKIHCLLTPELKVFFHLDHSVTEPQNEQFVGRVQCDTDALCTGLVRLHLSGVRAEDSGKYLCRMATESGKKVKVFSLNVTSACEKPEPIKPEPHPASRHRISLYAGLVLLAAAVVVLATVGVLHAVLPKKLHSFLGFL